MNLEANKEYSVNWKNHMSHVRKAFDHLLTSNELTDVTLCCEGKKMGAHKILLSACSAYFRDTFKEVPCQHPVIILYGVEYSVLLDILRFIYNGEVSVDTSKLDSFLKLAQMLQISGLTDNHNEKIIPEGNDKSQATTSSQATQEIYTEQYSTTAMPDAAPTSGDETKKGIKRSVSTVKQQETPSTKIQRQDENALFISDVKCEPSELVNFEDPLEDPLQSDQSQDTREFFGDAASQNSGEEEFKIEVEVEGNQKVDRFGDQTPTKKLIPRNTIKNRAYIWSTFNFFCKERRYTLNGSTTIEKISEILADWALNMRKTNGTDYKESVVKTIWNTTARMLQEMFYEKYKIKFDPFRDIDFKKARDSRDVKRRQLRCCPEKRKVSSVPFTDLERLQIYSIFDENTPDGLQRKFFHVAAFELSWKAHDAAYCLTQYFREEVNQAGEFTGRIEYNPMFGRPAEECHTYQSKWLVANTSDPSVCPVRLLLKLLNKRTTNSNVKTYRLFLTPNPNWSKSETNAWYKDCPVSKNHLATWTKEAAQRIWIDTKQIRVTNCSSLPSTSKLLL